MMNAIVVQYQQLAEKVGKYYLWYLYLNYEQIAECQPVLWIVCLSGRSLKSLDH